MKIDHSLISSLPFLLLLPHHGRKLLALQPPLSAPYGAQGCQAPRAHDEKQGAKDDRSHFFLQWLVP